MPNLNKFPLPPSVNQLYANNSGSGRGRFKTKIYLQFEKECKLWSIKNWQAIVTAQRELANAFLSIELKFYFPKAAIITKKGTAKRLDLDNRLKGILDQMVELLKLDDSCFFQINCYKLVGDGYVDIEINKMEMADCSVASVKSL